MPFDYYCSSWFTSLSAKWKHKLQVMQHKIIRFILKFEPMSHIGGEEFEMLGMLKVKDMIKQLKLNHVFKVYHDEATAYLISHLSASNFILPQVKDQACNAIFFTGIKEWNSLPNHIKTSKTHLKFKRLSKATFYPGSGFKFVISCSCFTRMCNNFCGFLFVDVLMR